MYNTSYINVDVHRLSFYTHYWIAAKYILLSISANVYRVFSFSGTQVIGCLGKHNVFFTY